MAVGSPASLSVLVVGEDASLVESGFERASAGPVGVTVDAVETATAVERGLDEARPDAVVVGPLPTGEAVAETVSALREADCEGAIVGMVEDPAGADDVLAAGATDYVLRSVAEDRPAFLANRVRQALGGPDDACRPGTAGWYDALLEQSVDALTVLDVDGTITYQNPSVERLLGYEPAALVGTDSREYVHPEDRDRVQATFERLFDRGDGASEDLQFRFRHADGSWEWLESVVTVRLDPGIGGFVVNSRLITERAEREREVERYETLLSVLPDTCAITDLDGNFVDIYGFEGWSGYDREELLGEHASRITPEEDLERAEAIVTDLILAEDREKAIFETHVETNDGERIPFENHVRPLPPDDTGTIPGTMNVMRNISGRKERERDLETAETVFTNVQDGVFLIDVTEDGQFELHRANSAFRSGVGLSDDEIQGITPRELAGPDVGAKIEGRLQECVDEAGPIEYENSLVVDGERRYFHNRMAPVFEDGDVSDIVGVSRDITERRRRTAELERKNRAMDEAPIGITVVEVRETGGEVTYVNDGFEELTGYVEEDFLAEGWEILHGRETDPDTVAQLQAAFANEETASGELQVYRKDGTPRWFQVSLSPVESEDGDVTHFVAFQQDITDRKEYETELERRFDEFAEVLADDLREPLEAARDAVEAAENGNPDALADAADWIERTDDLLVDLATVHSFSVPSRDHSESALLGRTEGE